MPTTRDPQGRLTLGGVRLGDLARDPALGTPAYVYDLDGIVAAARDLRAAFEGAPHLVCYAVKANSAGPIVRALAAEGCGADVVSGAELLVALGAGVPPESVVFSGVAKRDDELRGAVACGDGGIGAIQVESVEEVPRVAAVARSQGRRARVSIRINPAVDLDTLDTHASIATGHDEAKFGVPLDDVPRAVELVLRSHEALSLVGLTVHVGSQFTSTAAYVEAAQVCFRIASELRRAGAGGALRFVDTGGGFGIDYGAGCPVRPADFVREARAAQREAGLGDLALYVEPGRSLVAPHAVLLSSTIQPKVASHLRWLMIDAGMNDLVRPAMYQARHRIVPLDGAGLDLVDWGVVGPVCESSDDFGVHALPRVPPSHLAILDVGAYGYTMASQYNGRQLPVEVFLAGGRVVASSPRRRAEDWVQERLAVGLPASAAGGCTLA